MEFGEQEAEFNLNFGEIAAGGTSGVTSVNGKTGVVVLKTSDLPNDSGYQTSEDMAEAIEEHNQDPEAHPAIREEIADIEELVPEQATEENKLADKNFVNSSIATNTANYISKTVEGKKVPFDSLEELEAYSGTLTNNDYAFVIGTDSEGNTTYTRYKYNEDEASWGEEYVLNNSSFTAAQWAAINSGITSGKIEEIDEAIAGKVDKVAGKGLSTNDFTDAEKTKLAGLENTELLGSTGQSTTAGMTQKAITDALVSAGGVKVLTSADYNYPVNNPDSIAMWLMPNGVYYADEKHWITSNLSNRYSGLVIVGGIDGSTNKKIVSLNPNGAANSAVVGTYTVNKTTGNVTIGQPFLMGDSIVDYLTSTYTDRPLSANQGKVLNDKIAALEARIAALEGNA